MCLARTKGPPLGPLMHRPHAPITELTRLLRMLCPRNTITASSVHVCSFPSTQRDYHCFKDQWDDFGGRSWSLHQYMLD
jgi:hypothetical protein